MNAKTLFVCPQCGTKFLQYKSQVGDVAYCSRRCYHESKIGKEPHNKGVKTLASKPCAQCGKPMVGMPSSVKRRKYCSKECMAAAFSGNLELLLKRFRVDQETGCWLWEGYTRGGYGRLKLPGGKLCEAHRASYEFHIGKIPDGLVLDHLCRNHSCVNPTHLEVVTQAENIRRGIAGYNVPDIAQKKKISTSLKKHYADPANRMAQSERVKTGWVKRRTKKST